MLAACTRQRTITCRSARLLGRSRRESRGKHCICRLWASCKIQVGLKTRVTPDGLAPFTLGISVEREIALGGGGARPAGGAPAPAKSGDAKSGDAKSGAPRRPGAAARDPTLDSKLAELDAALDARFAAKGANPRRLANGVDVVSFRGAPKKA